MTISCHRLINLTSNWSYTLLHLSMFGLRRITHYRLWLMNNLQGFRSLYSITAILFRLGIRGFQFFTPKINRKSDESLSLCRHQNHEYFDGFSILEHSALYSLKISPLEIMLCYLRVSNPWLNKSNRCILNYKAEQHSSGQFKFLIIIFQFPVSEYPL